MKLRLLVVVSAAVVADVPGRENRKHPRTSATAADGGLGRVVVMHTGKKLIGLNFFICLLLVFKLKILEKRKKIPDT